MKFLLTGIETNNKGAELMLYAILQEIERKFPDSDVYIPEDRLRQGIEYIQTSLRIHLLGDNLLYKIIRFFKINQILRRLNIKFFFQHIPIVRDADYLLDGSGLHFTDHFSLPDKDVVYWSTLLREQNNNGSKIIFLPQAWGPIENKNTRLEVKFISDNSDLIFARESVSFEYLRKSNIVDLSKVKIRTDFTSLVDGVVISKYKHLEGGVCIIPNARMIRKGILSLDDYLSSLVHIINLAQEYGRKVFLLNHEGKADENLIIECKKKLGHNIEYITGQNALETKGIISTSYLIISSRYHGVASALNTCVPCLATSWSHKYECLFSDYELTNCIMPLSDIECCENMVRNFMSYDKNQEIRRALRKQMPKMRECSRNMWNEIWSI